MFKQMLYVNWKASRWAVLPFVLLSFGLPILTLRMADTIAHARTDWDTAAYLLSALDPWLPFYPLLAALTGFAVALCVWNWDQRNNYVYSLVLPLSRARYVLLKYTAGAAILLLPVAACLIGAVLAVAMVDIPQGLHAYPLQFSFRFLLAALLAYSVLYALAASTIRTAVYVLAGSLLFVIFGTILMEYLKHALRNPFLPTPIDLVTHMFVDWQGPFHVFGGSWLLIDV